MDRQDHLIKGAGRKDHLSNQMHAASSKPCMQENAFFFEDFCLVLLEVVLSGVLASSRLVTS